MQREDVSKILIKVHPRFGTVCNIEDPKFGLEIKFSFKMIAAMQMFNHDTSQLDIFSDEKCSNQKLIEFRKKVEVNFYDELKDFEAEVEVKLLSGQSYAKKYDLNTVVDSKILELRVRKKAQNLIGCLAEEKIWKMLNDKKISSNTFMQFLSELS